MSAVVRRGAHRRAANDETTSLERLTLEGDQARATRSFDPTDFLKLPGEREIDIEGLDVEGDTLSCEPTHHHRVLHRAAAEDPRLRPLTDTDDSLIGNGYTALAKAWVDGGSCSAGRRRQVPGS